MVSDESVEQICYTKTYVKETLTREKLFREAQLEVGLPPYYLKQTIYCRACRVMGERGDWDKIRVKN